MVSVPPAKDHWEQGSVFEQVAFITSWGEGEHTLLRITGVAVTGIRQDIV